MVPVLPGWKTSHADLHALADDLHVRPTSRRVCCLASRMAYWLNVESQTPWASDQGGEAVMTRPCTCLARELTTVNLQAHSQDTGYTSSANVYYVLCSVLW